MNEQKKELINYWITKAKEALDSASDEFKAKKLSFAVNRIYYGCFYIVYALLLKRDLKFKKHSGVRSAFHKYFVKTGLVDLEWGKFYDEIFEARQRADYIELVSFEEEQVNEWLQKAQAFVKK